MIERTEQGNYRVTRSSESGRAVVPGVTSLINVRQYFSSGTAIVGTTLDQILIDLAATSIVEFEADEAR